MNDFPDLYAFVMTLYPEGGSSLRPQGHGAQALFLDLVRQVEPELAVQLHAEAKSKPYTVALLSRGQRVPVELRVSLLQAELFQPFVQALLRQMPGEAPLRLGQARLRLGDVIGTPAPKGHSWAGYSSFAELHSRAEPAHTVILEFASATVIGQGSRADGRPRLALLPDPALIFPSLAKRWNELAPAPLELDLALLKLAINETVVTRYHAESTEIDLGKGPQKGFVGVCAYELPRDPAQARLLCLLADAALFLGVGMKTARGMGLCRRLFEREAIR
ncbi:CRISPR system precrRNA processing endoribonuclease RAMP protein Cas6 [Candidatus Chloroploca sp. Khr17]|uniref:CRISPR system precrRNA processing endoribonuclease RAMP protein Cas6 n=1 Tax=Candidatus Chloroploca sp. Khr17 TaxID=2496869 RepID=UPI00101E08FB|nr:CRISPR system precrRNA processing endoribonuclease RAMP protein Cas6 [Candidatus Chloroploca sp. Khr17]